MDPQYGILSMPGTGFFGMLVIGFLAGWSVAFLRNAVVFAYMATSRWRTERQLMRKLPEYL